MGFEALVGSDRGARMGGCKVFRRCEGFWEASSLQLCFERIGVMSGFGGFGAFRFGELY